VYGSEIFKLDDLINRDFDMADFARIRDEDSALRDETLRTVAIQMGEDVDADILRKTVMAGGNWLGTPGADIASIEALMDAFVRLKQEGVPEADIYAVLAYQDMAGLAKYLVQTSTANMNSQESVLAKFGDSPRLKELVGMKVLFTQQLPVLVTGTRVNGTVNGASQSVNYSAVAQSTTTNGNFLTQTLSIAGVGANATIRDGEVFTLAGVDAWDNRKNATQGRPQQFRVIGDHTATAGGAVAALRIYPAIIPANGSIIGAAGVDNAHATVNAAPANGAAITFVGAANSSYLQRAVIGRAAVRVETARLEDLASGETSHRQMRSIPLHMRLHKYSNGDTGVTRLRFDSAYTPNILPFGRSYVCRVNG